MKMRNEEGYDKVIGMMILRKASRHKLFYAAATLAACSIPSTAGYCPGPSGLIHILMLPGFRTPFSTPASSIRASSPKVHLSQYKAVQGQVIHGDPLGTPELRDMLWMQNLLRLATSLHVQYDQYEYV